MDGKVIGVYEAAYTELCERVEKIDVAAAKYMRSPAARKGTQFAMSGSLLTCFEWKKIPQGWRYWHSICRLLEDSKGG